MKKPIIFILILISTFIFGFQSLIFGAGATGAFPISDELAQPEIQAK